MKLKLERPLVFFDLETTGVNVGKDKIVEISMVQLHPDHSDEAKTLLINPGIHIPEETSAIHGIYDDLGIHVVADSGFGILKIVFCPDSFPVVLSHCSFPPFLLSFPVLFSLASHTTVLTEQRHRCQHHSPAPSDRCR